MIAFPEMLVPAAEKAGIKAFNPERDRNLYSQRNGLSNGTLYEWDVED